MNILEFVQGEQRHGRKAREEGSMIRSETDAQWGSLFQSGTC